MHYFLSLRKKIAYKAFFPESLLLGAVALTFICTGVTLDVHWILTGCVSVLYGCLLAMNSGCTVLYVNWI